LAGEELHGRRPNIQGSVLQEAFVKKAVRYLVLATLLVPVLQFPVLAQSSPQIPAATPIEVTLLKPLDVKKNKVGDEVDAKVMRDLKVGGNVIIPKDSKLIGQLAEVGAKSKDHPQSFLTINFERCQLKGGGEIPVTANIQALAKPYDARAQESNDILRGAGFDQTLSGPAAGAAGSGVSLGGSTGVLTLRTQGVLGYTGIGVHNATIYSPARNIQLDNGTHMILQLSGK
jgi:hypothetical protein